jgi:hypothetical protein
MWEWRDLLSEVEQRFEHVGVQRDLLMPLSYSRGSEVLNSAVQAMDPYVKDGKSFVLRRGLMLQPVVRLGSADTDTRLLPPGFLTSFVSLSRVHPIDTFADYARAAREGADILVDLLSDVRGVRLSGSLSGWRREEVEGFTLRIHVGNVELGDFVFVRGIKHPDKTAFDMGVSVERLRWMLTGMEWHSSTFGNGYLEADATGLDALRTAVLLVGNGIDAAPRGRGSVTRRVIRRAREFGAEDISLAYVEEMHEFWSSTGIWLRPAQETHRRIVREVHSQAA